MRLILLFTVVVVGATAFELDFPRSRAEVFSNQAQKTTNFCQACRSIVSYMRQFNRSESRDDNRDLLKSFCELYYPVSTDYQQGPCPVFVEGFFYVLNQVDPVHHCDQIGACGETANDSDMSSWMGMPNSAMTVTNQVPVDDASVCKVCVELVQQVKKQLEDPDFVKQVQERIDAFCAYLKVINQEEVCKTMLKQNLDEAIEFIEAIDPGKYCQSLQLCAAGKLAGPKTKLPALVDFSNFGIETSVEMGGSVVKDIDSFDRRIGPSCTFCKKLVQEMFKFLRDNRTEENIREGLDQICSLVYSDGPKRTQCDQLVATYSKEFVDVLTQETDPELVCIVLSQCYDNIRISYPEISATSLGAPVDSTPESSDVSMSEFISILDPTIKIGSLRSCVECKLFISYLQDTLSDTKSQEDVKEWLIKNLCDSLEDQSMKESCTNLVEKRAADFFKAIVENMNPRTTCVELGACKSRKVDFSAWSRNPISVLLLSPLNMDQAMGESMFRSRPWLEQEISRKSLAKKPATPFCEGCVQVVGMIDEYLSTHTIQHDVEELNTEVCDKLPTVNSRKGCTLLIQYYGQEIMQHISTMDEPRQLCTKITLC